MAEASGATGNGAEMLWGLLRSHRVMDRGHQTPQVSSEEHILPENCSINPDINHSFVHLVSLQEISKCDD